MCVYTYACAGDEGVLRCMLAFRAAQRPRVKPISN